MAENKRQYTIEINGIRESVSAIDALLSKLNELDIKINRFSGATINVSTNVSNNVSGGSSRNEALQTEDKLLKQIYATEQQINDARREEYQSLLANKELLKEATEDAKERAAQERLAANAYSNTMAGLKAQLADIKKVMNTTDLSSEEFGNLVKTANELNAKLKTLEQSYGQFGRNVGNYTNSIEDALDNVSGSFTEITVKVGDTERSFRNVREATRTLTQELQAMVIQGKEGTKEYNELAEALHQYQMALQRAQSATNDLKASSQWMDSLLDTAQSLTAIGSVSNGLSAIFGFDDNKVARSIQKLQGLQTVLKGIETLKKQLNTQEGIGSILAKGSGAIDGLIAKITGAKITTDGLTASTKRATVAVRALSAAIKAIGVGVLIAGISWAIDKLSELGSKQVETERSTAQLARSFDVLNGTITQLMNDINAKRFFDGIISSEEFATENLKTFNFELLQTIDLLEKMVAFNKSLGQSYMSGGYSMTTDSQLSETLEGLRQDYTETFKVMEVLEEKYGKIEDDIFSIIEAYNLLHNSVMNNENAFKSMGEGLGDWIKSYTLGMDSTIKTMDSLGNIALGNLISQFSTLIMEYDRGKISIEEYQEEIDKLATYLISPAFTNIRSRLEDSIPDEAMRTKLQSVIDKIFELNNALNEVGFQDKAYWEQVAIDTMKDSWEKRKRQIDLEKKQELASRVYTKEQIQRIEDKYRHIEEEARKDWNEQQKQERDKVNSEIYQAEKNLQDMRINLLKDSLTKTLALLEEERKAKLRDITESGRLVGERELALNQLYDEKMLDARIKYHKDMLAEDRSYADKYLKLQNEINSQRSDVYKLEVQNTLSTSISNITATPDVIDISAMKEYATLINGLTTQYSSFRKAVSGANQKTLEEYAELKDRLDVLSESIKSFGEDVSKSILDEYDDVVEKMTAIERKYAGIEQDIQGNAAASLKRLIDYRYETTEDYFNKVLKLTTEAADKETKIEKDKLERQLEDLRKAEDERHNLLVGRIDEQSTPMEALTEYQMKVGVSTDISSDMEEWRIEVDKWLDDLRSKLQEGVITEKEYLSIVDNEYLQSYIKRKDEYDSFSKWYGMQDDKTKEKEKSNLERHTKELNDDFVEYLDRVMKEFIAHNDKMEVISSQHNARMENINAESLKKVQAAYSTYFQQVEQEIERAMGGIENKLSTSYRNNEWVPFNLSNATRNLRDVQSSVETVLEKVVDERNEASKKFSDGLLDKEQYQAIIDQLDNVEVRAIETAQQVKERLSEIGGEWWGTINQWVSQVGSTMNTILGSLSEIQQNQYDKQIEEIDKYIDELSERLEEIEDVIREHNDNVNSIEDELKTARGDRRQALIDQLNAEKQAQKEALAQEKLIQKQKEAEEKRQKKLEHDAAVAKKKMQLAQAAINMSMAISMAAVNSWPIPAIPLMAMAAAAGAAQIAAIRSTNIPSYGDGGVLQGPSHKQGGIKVLGGTAEVEGKEFITNKVTTQKNVELLYYINSKKKKLSLEDFIDFYSDGKKVSTNVRNIGNKYASGGQLPNIRTDVNINDRLLEAFESYSNRPVVVQTVDIINRIDDITQVQVLAGLEQ